MPAGDNAITARYCGVASPAINQVVGYVLSPLQGVGVAATVFGAQAVLVLREERRLESVDERSQANHLAAPHSMVKPFIRALIRSSA